ncbi:MAG TPA: hypothetical protein VGH14_12875 [Solirubrobacterales bacterium]
MDGLGVEGGREVLDLGCGDATTALRAAERGAQVLGVDIADEGFHLTLSVFDAMFDRAPTTSPRRWCG